MKTKLKKLALLVVAVMIMITPAAALAAPLDGLEPAAEPSATATTPAAAPPPAPAPAPTPAPDPRPFPQWMNESSDLPMWIYTVDVFPDWFYELEAEPVWFRQIDRIPAWFYSLTEIPAWFYPAEPVEAEPLETETVEAEAPEPEPLAEDTANEEPSGETDFTYELPTGFEAPVASQNMVEVMLANSAAPPALIFKTLLADGTAAEAALEILPDGSSELYGPITFLAAGDAEYDISVWLNSSAIRVYDSTLSEAGRYYITITDMAGNSTAYAFRILYVMNVPTVWVIVIAALLIVALMAYLLRNRLKVRVR